MAGAIRVRALAAAALLLGGSAVALSHGSKGLQLHRDGPAWKADEHHVKEKVEEKARYFAETCQCLSWREAFRHGGVTCGGTKGPNEGTPDENKEAAEATKAFCTHFYEKATFSSCTNIKYSRDDKAQWCYVSSGCTELNGGREVHGSELSWKVCRKGEDDLLSSKSVEELFNVSRDSDLDFGLLAKMAYPVNTGMKWADVKGMLLHGVPTGHKGTNVRLQSAVDAKRPLIFDSPDEDPKHSPFYILQGARIFAVAASDWLVNSAARGLDPYAHPNRIHDYKCIKGCGRRLP
mmetsp:Transcript_77255/g.218671  ORF Transcript_77255/g.218671 Transcript_77255/m.218671 type:complete len:292 (-) Transcript_77255:77-952(-)